MLGTGLRPQDKGNFPHGLKPQTWLAIPLVMMSAKLTLLLCCKSCPNPCEIFNKHVLPKTLKENVEENENLKGEFHHRHCENGAISTEGVKSEAPSFSAGPQGSSQEGMWTITLQTLNVIKT